MLGREQTRRRADVLLKGLHTRKMIDTSAGGWRYTDVVKNAEADGIKLMKDEMGRNGGEQMASGARSSVRFGPSIHDIVAESFAESLDSLSRSPVDRRPDDTAVPDNSPDGNTGNNSLVYSLYPR